MWTVIAIGCLLIVFSIFMHAMATRFAMYLATRHTASSAKYKISSRGLWLSLIVLIMFFASIIEALAWAESYLILDAIGTMEEALYFSIVTFTTLGYGDITLGEDYRLLASIEAANGIIIFGWTTAITMAVVQKLYLKR